MSSLYCTTTYKYLYFKCHSRYVHEDVERQWNQHNPENKDTVDWAEYRNIVYGFMDEEDEQEDQGYSYAQVTHLD